MGGGGNWEFEYYINNRTNSYVKDNTLYLRPTLTADRLGKAQVAGTVPMTLDIWGGTPADECTSNAFYGCSRSSGGTNVINPIQSARVRTAGTFSFKYGRLEVEAKLPKGDWIWPAIWLLPEEQAYGQWPASGEIDLMESRGNDASYFAGGVNCFGSTLHWGPFFPEDPFQQTHGDYCLDGTGGKTLNDDFHVYGLVWNENEIYTYLDNDANRILNHQVNTSFWELGGWSKNPTLHNPWFGQPDHAPFDQKFYLIFNVAVGGVNGYFPDGVGGKPWSDTSNNAAQLFNNALDAVVKTWDLEGEGSALGIRSVKVWQ
jgi:beta-glucanase (GH16 family)